MKNELTERQLDALRIISTRYKGNEITGKEVANMIQLKERHSGKNGADFRAIVNALRQHGYPICANGNGYYYPLNRAQIEEYEESLRRRIDSEMDALGGIQRALMAWDSRPEVREPRLEQLQLLEV